MIFDNVVVSRKKKAAGPASRIMDLHAGFGFHYFNKRINERARSEILPCATLHVSGVLLKESFIRITFNINLKTQPVFPINQISDQFSQLGRVLNLVLGFSENDATYLGKPFPTVL